MGIYNYINKKFLKKNSKAEKKPGRVRNPTYSKNPKKFWKGTPKIRKPYWNEPFDNSIDINIKYEKELYKYIFRCLIIIILFICLLAYYNKDNLTFIKI